MNQHIEARPEILGGKPCIRGTRLSVEFILELLSDGASQAEILEAYPQVSTEALRAAIQYAVGALKNEVVWDIKISA